LRQKPKSRLRFAASIDEASLHAARNRRSRSNSWLHSSSQPNWRAACSRGDQDSLRHLVLFPKIGRRQATEGVRKLVTRKYAYLVYYTIDDAAEEIVILTIQHPARERAFEDA
jgi:plasmid stabilization system protein ParE